MKFPSEGEAKYFVTLWDKCTGFSMGRFIFVIMKLANFVKEILLQRRKLFNYKYENILFLNWNTMKWIRSSSGCEYVELEFWDRVEKRGIVQEVTTAY